MATLLGLGGQVPRFIEEFEWSEKSTPFAHPAVPWIAIVVYLITLKVIHTIMKTREGFKLKLLVAGHNAFLSLGSLVMLVAIAAGVAGRLRETGGSVFEIVCDPTGAMLTGWPYFWLYVFYLSKYYELLDTVFLALKKRELKFLQVYHHCLTLFTAWAGMTTETSYQWWAAILNTFVHTLMYYYFVVQSFGFRPWWKKYLTVMQMVQFWLNIGITLLWLFYWVTTDYSCSGEIWSWALALVGMLTFFALFQRFYKKTYEADGGKAAKADKSKVDKSN